MSVQNPATLLMLFVDMLQEQDLTTWAVPSSDEDLNTDDAIAATKDRCREGLVCFVVYLVARDGGFPPHTNVTPQALAFQAAYKAALEQQQA